MILTNRPLRLIHTLSTIHRCRLDTLESLWYPVGLWSLTALHKPLRAPFRFTILKRVSFIPKPKISLVGFRSLPRCQAGVRAFPRSVAMSVRSFAMSRVALARSATLARECTTSRMCRMQWSVDTMHSLILVGLLQWHS